MTSEPVEAHGPTRTGDVAARHEAAQDTDTAVAIETQGFQWMVAFAGAIVAGLGLSGLLDDSGLIEHPWWVVLVAAAALGCGLVIIRTLRALEGQQTG